MRIISSMTSAIHEMHTKVKAAHLDVKLQNFVIDKNLVINLIDFGFSRLLSYESDPNCIAGPLQSGRGTYSYMAPEVASSSSYDTLKADIFSLGVCMLAVATLSNPLPKERIGYSDVVTDIIKSG